jgi:hypothetical protein
MKETAFAFFTTFAVDVYEDERRERRGNAQSSGGGATDDQKAIDASTVL